MIIFLFYLGSEDLPTTYTNGPKDFCTIFFYSLAWIVVHAIIQEYIWDVRFNMCRLSLVIKVVTKKSSNRQNRTVFECCKTKTVPYTYQLDYSANLKKL